MNSFGTAPSRLSETHNLVWNQPPNELELENDEVHVWLVSIDAADLNRFEPIVSEDERRRAERFHFRQNKVEYLISKGFLREILAKYVKIDPKFLRFHYNEYGKPILANETKSRLKFSVSHSNGAAVFAVTRENELGVDLEFIDSAQICAESARRTLTVKEFTHFKQLNARERQTFFYKCWTRKEAFLKALGKGLIIEPNQIETLCPSVLSKCPAINKNSMPPMPEWLFFDAPVLKDFAIAVTTKGAGKTAVKYWVV